MSAPAMFMRRSALALSSRTLRPHVARRGFALSAYRRADDKHGHDHGHGHDHIDLSPVQAPEPGKGPMIPFDEVKSEKDLFGPGTPPGNIPTDLEQSTGLERLEILGKMQGIDIFDMRPLDASRKGTVDDPIVVNSVGDKRYVGCTGYPADSHPVVWVTTSIERPHERCRECGSVYKMNYIGVPAEEAHRVPDWEPKDFSDFVKDEYKGWPEGKAKA